MSQQDLDCPSHLAEAKEVSQDQVPLQLPPVGGNWNFSIYFSRDNFVTTRGFTESTT